MAAPKKSPSSKPPAARVLILQNKKAQHRYELLESIEAGIVLKGCEVKSLRGHDCNFGDAFCSLMSSELWLHGLHIKPYPQANLYRPDPDRKRKLLLHRREIERLTGRADRTGLTIVPTRLYFNGRRVKVEIALARGKKLHDKREDLKRRDDQRDMDRAMRRGE